MPWDLRAVEELGLGVGSLSKFTQQVYGQEQDGGLLPPGTGSVGAMTPT